MFSYQRLEMFQNGFFREQVQVEQRLVVHTFVLFSWKLSIYVYHTY